MLLSDYDFPFPQESIAMHPPENRGDSKLFVVYTQTSRIQIATYNDLDQFLLPSDHLVRNVTKVFHARLFGIPIMKDGSKLPEVEVFITEPHAQSLDEYVERQWNAEHKGFSLEFLSTLKRQQIAQLSHIEIADGFEFVAVEKVEDSFIGVLRKPEAIITAHDVFSLLEKHGKVPLPPYIKRKTDKFDDARYQTVFAQKTGSVAAPTASLNFTKELESRLQTKHITLDEIILHVGRGTFMPLREKVIENNILHHEPYFVPTETLHSLYEAKMNLKRVIALGTTVTRTLETVASQILQSEKLPILDETNLFIYPPYEFKIVDGLLTNFHFPKSSLITLVDAFLQWKQSQLTWREIYEFAIAHEAKLFSYGDSMLLV